MNQLLRSISTIRWRCAIAPCWKVMYGAGLRLSAGGAGLPPCRHGRRRGGDGEGSKSAVPIGRTAVTGWNWLAMRDLFGPEDDAMFLSNQGRRIFDAWRASASPNGV